MLNDRNSKLDNRKKSFPFSVFWYFIFGLYLCFGACYLEFIPLSTLLQRESIVQFKCALKKNPDFKISGFKKAGKNLCLFFNQPVKIFLLYSELEKLIGNSECSHDRCL